MNALVAFDTIGGTVGRALYGAAVLPGELLQPERLVLDNGDLILPDDSGGELFVVSRLAGSAGRSWSTWAACYRLLPPAIRRRRGEYYGVGVWMLDGAALPGGSLAELLRLGAGRLLQVLEARRGEWRTSDLTLETMGLDVGHVADVLARSRYASVEAGLGTGPNLDRLFVKVADDRAVADVLAELQQGMGLAGFRRGCVTSDTRMWREIEARHPEQNLFRMDATGRLRSLARPAPAPAPADSRAEGPRDMVAYSSEAGAVAPPARRRSETMTASTELSLEFARLGSRIDTLSRQVEGEALLHQRRRWELWGVALLVVAVQVVFGLLPFVLRTAEAPLRSSLEPGRMVQTFPVPAEKPVPPTASPPPTPALPDRGIAAVSVPAAYGVEPGCSEKALEAMGRLDILQAKTESSSKDRKGTDELVKELAAIIKDYRAKCLVERRN